MTAFPDVAPAAFITEHHMVFLEPAQARSLIDQLSAQLEHSVTGHLRILVEPQFTERRLAIGDRVRVPFDRGFGPATVAGFTPEGRVEVTYGPGDRHRTTLDRHNVLGGTPVEHPAILKVKVGEGAWSPPITSDLPNGGY